MPARRPQRGGSAGKGSTWAIYINADDIAATRAGSARERALAAQVEADRLRERCLVDRASFTFETVMSHPSKVDLMRRARIAGFDTQLFFVGTDDPETNVERVAQRVNLGGHDVPIDKIVARWARTMALLADAVRACDRSLVFDNSAVAVDGSGMRLVAERVGPRGPTAPRWQVAEPVPAWVRVYLLDPLTAEL